MNFNKKYLKYKNKYLQLKNQFGGEFPKCSTFDELKEFYNNILFRKLDFRRYVKTKQSEYKLLDEIENNFLTTEDKLNDKKLLIFYGNWSKGGNTLKGTVSTPGISFKRLLHKRFKILETDEFKTSKLYNKTFKEMINIKVKKGKHIKKLHEILTPKEETEKRIYVNRDKNACKNILYIGKYFLEKQLRPVEFQRNKKMNIFKKAINLTKHKPNKKSNSCLIKSSN